MRAATAWPRDLTAEGRLAKAAIRSKSHARATLPRPRAMPPPMLAMRFDQVTSDLAAGEDPTQITAGLAELRPDETADELIARADRDMIVHRQTARPRGDSGRPLEVPRRP